MKNIIAFLFLISTISTFASAQSSLPELEIAKEIKLFKSTRANVRAIMSEFDRPGDDEEDETDEYFYEEFRSDNVKVGVSYSTGDCLEDAGTQNQPEWNVPKWTATKVTITFGKEPKLVDLGLNLSRFTKKPKDEEDEEPEEFIYYDENAGIIIVTGEGEVEKIILHPPQKRIGFLCSNENNEEILSGEESFVDSIANSGYICILRNIPSNVAKLDLPSKGSFGCKNENCADAKKEIPVRTTAVDPEADQLVYNYTVSGGKINGSGAIVDWDLTGVLPGTYTITAGSDDGCGICGETKSRKISVKENSFEITPLAEIKELILDKTELLAACPVGRLRRISCPAGNCAVSVASVSEDKNLTYEYKTSGGEIVGSGDKIVWNLANLKTGEYSIFVSASDDGVGFGEWKEATVTIKENPACSAPKK